MTRPGSSTEEIPAWHATPTMRPTGRRRPASPARPPSSSSASTPAERTRQAAAPTTESYAARCRSTEKAGARGEALAAGLPASETPVFPLQRLALRQHRQVPEVRLGKERHGHTQPATHQGRQGRE